MRVTIQMTIGEFDEAQLNWEEHQALDLTDEEMVLLVGEEGLYGIFEALRREEKRFHNVVSLDQRRVLC